jgi:hypothetical protein
MTDKDINGMTMNGAEAITDGDSVVIWTAHPRDAADARDSVEFGRLDVEETA